MSNAQQLYFIAIIPPDDICSEVTTIKQDFATRFASKRALRVVPHITLKAPFKIFGDQEQQLLEWFSAMPVTINSFQQELKNFGAFPNKRNLVIFIDPILNNALQLLQKEIIANFKIKFNSIPLANNETRFHPHVTVAYRDLTYSNFIEAWKEYEQKKFEAKFQVNGFHLLQHDGKRWNSVSIQALKK